MSSPHGSMTIPLKGNGGALPEYRGQGGVYVPGTQSAQLSGNAAAIAAQGYQAANRATAETYGALASIGKNMEGAVQTGIKAIEGYHAAVAQKAFNDYELEDMKLRAELNTLQGQNALGKDGVGERIKKWREAARQRLTSDMGPLSRDLFNRNAEKLDARTDAWAVGKEWRENVAFQNSVSEGAIHNAQLQVMEDPANTANLDSAIGIMAAEISRMAERNGWDDAYREARIAEAAQKMSTERVNALIDSGNLAAASAALGRSSGTIAEDLHNPLNLKIPGHNGSDRSDFQNFASDADGYRGAWGQIKLYWNRDGLRKVKDIVGKWAPPKENNLNDYFATLSQLGVGREDVLDPNNPGDAAKLLKAMSVHEGPVGKKYSAAQIQAMLMENGGKAQRLEPWGGGSQFIAPGDRGRLARKIDAAIMHQENEARRQTAELRADVELQLRDTEAALRNGLDAKAPDTAEIIAAYRKDAPKVLQALDELRVFSQDLRVLQEMDAASQQKLLAERKPEPGEGFARKDRVYDWLVKAMVDDAKARKKDGAAYIVACDEKTRLAHSDFVQKQDEATWKEYRLALVAGAQSRGMEVKLLPKSDATYFSDILEKSSDPAKDINSFREMLGDDFAPFLECIAPKLSDTIQLIANDMPPDAAAKLWSAARNQDFEKHAKDYIANQTFTEADLKRSVANSLMAFRESLLDGGDSGMAQAAYAATRKLALVKIIQDGMSYEDAVEKAADEVVLSRYKFMPNLKSQTVYRMPIAYKDFDMNAGLRKVVDQIDIKSINNDLTSGSKFKSADEILKITLLREAQFVTSEDEKGVYVFIGSRPIRYKKDNKPVLITWEEAKNASFKDYSDNQYEEGDN